MITCCSARSLAPATAYALLALAMYAARSFSQMPPYTPVKSKAQSRALFAKANRGEMSMEDARGKTRAADFQSLPERLEKRSAKRGKRARLRPSKR